MKLFLLMVVLGLMPIAGSQPIVPAPAQPTSIRTVDIYEHPVFDLGLSESKNYYKRSDNGYARYSRHEYPHVQRFYPVAGSTMLIGYPLITERGGINGHGGYGRVIPMPGRYSYGR